MKGRLEKEKDWPCTSHLRQLQFICSNYCVWGFLKKKIFIYLSELVFVVAHRIFRLHHSMWDLVPWPGIEPRLPALGAWSLSHRNTREAPNYFLLCGQYCPEVTQVPVLMNKQAQSLVTASVRILHRNKTQRKAGGLDPVWEPQTRDPGRAKLLSPFCSIQAFNWLDEAHSG